MSVEQTQAAGWWQAALKCSTQERGEAPTAPPILAWGDLSSVISRQRPLVRSTSELPGLLDPMGRTVILFIWRQWREFIASIGARDAQQHSYHAFNIR